jgi:nucleoside-diphosphate-sugar epimerase
VSEPHVVTGASGWLGRRLVRALTVGAPEMGSAGTGGRRVRVLAEPGAEPLPGVESIEGDLRAPDVGARLLAGCEGAVVYHLAGVIHPTGGVKQFDEVNLDGALRVVDAAAQSGARRVVVMSSNSPIGVSKNPHEVFDEGSPYRPYMGYGRSKMRLEQRLAQQYPKGGPLEVVVIRAPWFYGPEQPARQTRFFSMVKEGRFPLMGKGLNRRSMAYVDSLAYGLLLAGAAPNAAGETYWIADERPYPMREVVDTVRDVLRDDFGISVKPKTISAPPVIADCARLADAMLQAVGLYQQEIHVLSEMNLTIACSIDKAKRELGYRPLVDLREGMRRSVAWILDHGGQI